MIFEPHACIHLINVGICGLLTLSPALDLEGKVQEICFCLQVSSVAEANPLDVEDYLDCFEDISSTLLEYIVNMTDVTVSFTLAFELFSQTGHMLWPEKFEFTDKFNQLWGTVNYVDQTANELLIFTHTDVNSLL